MTSQDAVSVERIAVGSGSPEGTNSAYVLPDRGLVVDPGPPAEAAWNVLCAGLADAGLNVADVEDVFVTHWHVDHSGLAPCLADASGATIHMHERDAPFVATYEKTHERRRQRDADRLRDWGVPADAVATVQRADTPSPLPSETPVSAHEQGDAVSGGTVCHIPGHTEGHATLAVDGHRFVGDAILPTYTPNVGGSDTRADAPLASFLTSLDRLERETGTIHPGHGTAIAPERFETIRAHHRDRSQRVLDAVGTRDRPTPWAVAVDLFGEMAGIHVKFGAGEAYAHLAHLAEAGDIRQVDDDPLRYESRRPSGAEPSAFE